MDMIRQKQEGRVLEVDRESKEGKESRDNKENRENLALKLK